MDSLEDYVELLYEGKDKVRGKKFLEKKGRSCMKQPDPSGVWIFSGRKTPDVRYRSGIDHISWSKAKHRRSNLPTSDTSSIPTTVHDLDLPGRADIFLICMICIICMICMICIICMICSHYSS